MAATVRGRGCALIVDPLTTLTLRAVQVPLKLPLQTGGGLITQAPLALAPVMHTLRNPQPQLRGQVLAPLAELLGGSAPSVPAYDSNGLGTIGPERAPAEAQALVAAGFRAIGDGLRWIEEPTLADDVEGHARIRAKSRAPVQMGEDGWGPHDRRAASRPEVPIW